MNDIELVGEGNKFDWNFHDGDVSNVTGDAALVSQVRHVILLHQGELEQEIYKNKGCTAYDYVKYADTETTLSLIQQSIQDTCNLLSGVKNSLVDVEYNNGVILIKKVHITKDDLEEIEIGF